MQCNAHCNTHCNAKIRHIIPKFCSRAVILLRSSSATVDIIPNNLVFCYVILLRSSELQPKLQRTMMTSFQKFASEQWFCSGAILQQLTSFQNFCSGAVQCNANCDALCCLEWTLIYLYYVQSIRKQLFIMCLIWNSLKLDENTLICILMESSFWIHSQLAECVFFKYEFLSR